MARCLDPKIIEKTKNIDSKGHHKIDQFLDRFLIDVCSVLDAKLVPCWPPFSAQGRPRGLQDGSKTVQDSSQDALDCPSQPKTPPNLPRSLPDLDFWSMFGWFFCWFMLISGRFFVDFLVDFCHFWYIWSYLDMFRYSDPYLLSRTFLSSDDRYLICLWWISFFGRATATCLMYKRYWET